MLLAIDEEGEEKGRTFSYIILDDIVRLEKARRVCVLRIPGEEYRRRNDQNRRVDGHRNPEQADDDVSDTVRKVRLYEVDAVVFGVGEMVPVFAVSGDAVGTRDFEETS